MKIAGQAVPLPDDAEKRQAPPDAPQSPVVDDIHRLRSAVAMGARQMEDTRQRVFIAASVGVAGVFFFFWLNSLLDPASLYTTYYHIFFAAAYALLGASAYFENRLSAWQKLLATWLMIPAFILLTTLNGAYALIHIATYITGSYIVSGKLYARTTAAAIIGYAALSAALEVDAAETFVYQRVLITAVLNVFTIEVFIAGVGRGLKGIHRAAERLESMSDKLEREFEARCRAQEENNREYLKDAISRAEKVALRNLTSSINHEFLNPLKAMHGVNRVLGECGSDARRQELLLASDAALEHLTQITERLLDIRQMRAGQLKARREPLDVRRLLTTLETAAVSRFLDHPVRCEVEVDPDVPAIVLGDEPRLRQVLFNVTGAVYHGETDGCLQLGCKVVQNYQSSIKLAFTVRYTREVPPSSVLDCQVGAVHGGGQIDLDVGHQGLGRIVANELLQGLGGSSLAESVTEKGQFLSFTLTLEKASEAKQEQEAATDAATETRDPGREEELSGLKILVVDDNQLSRLMSEEILKRHGARTLSANNGLQALNCLEQEKGQVDVVLMDVQMPVLDGIEATRLIRSGEQTSTIPVIAVTANTLPEDLELYAAVGMNGCLSKPLDSALMIDEVLRHVSVTETS